MLVATAEALDPSAVLLALSVVLVVAAGVTQAVLWAITRPAQPTAAQPTDELGAETPALVDLVTGGFAVDDDAVPATVVDLAARGWFDIEEVAGGNVILRLQSGRGDVTRYEDRVIHHVRRLAVDGVVPAAALTIGTAGVSKRWWKGFVREVNAHGREMGLNRRRWDLRHLSAMWLPVGLAWVAVILTSATADRTEQEGAWGEPSSVLAGVCLFSVLGLSYVARRVSSSDAQAETDAGLDVGGHWLGVRRWMDDHGDFGDKPAASVAIWGRHLAYATAMGLAPVVQRQLPFDTEHDRHAWSRASGGWRRVTVCYRAWRPGWGRNPWSVAFTGLGQGAIAGLIGYWGLRFAREAVDVSDLPEGAQTWLPVIGLAVAVLALPILLWSAAKVVMGVLDIVPRSTIEGELVRKREFVSGHRLPRALQRIMSSGGDGHGMSRDHDRRTRWHVAIDDGRSDRIVAHQVRRELFAGVRQGGRVRATFSPLLGYVVGLEQLTPPPGSEAPVPGEATDEVTGSRPKLPQTRPRPDNPDQAERAAE
ncbi:MAG: DUF2207 domain-containing protein [Acidimicrobiia bacterium]|nr:DUF2207 domain-containing protein [Acidimicrobiia bacterium]